MIKYPGSRNYVVIVFCAIAILLFGILYFISKYHNKILSSLPGHIYYADSDYLYKYDFKTASRNKILQLYSTNGSHILERSKYSLSRGADIICYVESNYTKNVKGPSEDDSLKLFVVNCITKKTLYQYTFDLNIFVYSVSIAPDADKLAVVYSICDKETQQPKKPCVDIISVKDGSIRKLSIAVGMHNYNGVSWSACGKQIVFLDPNMKPKILNLESMKTKKIAPGNGPVMWSPSGRCIAIGSNKLYDTISERLISINLPAEAIIAGWSPDSTMILFETLEVLAKCFCFGLFLCAARLLSAKKALVHNLHTLTTSLKRTEVRLTRAVNTIIAMQQQYISYIPLLLLLRSQVQ